jgi:DNA-binding transcriptional MerR regulator
MKTGTLAKRLRIDPKTVKAWTDEYREFFTKDAVKDDGVTQREYHPDDILALNTIRVLKNRKLSSDHIRDQLKQGYREQTLPPELSSIDGENAMLVYAEVAQLRLHIQTLETENERLRQQLGERDERVIRAEREAERWKTRYEILKEQMEEDE